jgi:hypothetical protein
VPWFLHSLVSSVAHRSGKEISALDNTFALIDEYICPDLSFALRFSLQSCGTIHSGTVEAKFSSNRPTKHLGCV